MHKILVTGGAGYIGSHVVKALGEQGYQVITYDNLSTGNEWAVLYGDLIIGDILDERQLTNVFEQNKIDLVIHLAAHVSVPESVSDPLKYYSNNLEGTLCLLRVMQMFKVRKLIFSSTAAVYGIPENVTVKETELLNPINPYGQSKAFVEKILMDLSKTHDFHYVALRYFNVAGADPQQIIGEAKEHATHLINQCLSAAAGKICCLKIFGNDYSTPDGSCIRDFIHVSDLSNIHVLALQYLLQGGKSDVFNCGYSKGYSVYEVVNMAKRITNVDFSVEITARRKADIPALIADSSKIVADLGWIPQYDDLDTIITTAWLWEKRKKYK
jgi:UDP-glucose 4-epimerase